MTRIGQWQRNSLLVGVAATLLAIAGFLLDRGAIPALLSFRLSVLARDGGRMPGNLADASHRRRQVGDDDPPHVRGGSAHAALHDHLADPGLAESSDAISVGPAGGGARCQSRGEIGVPQYPRRPRPRGVLFRHLDPVRVLFEQVVRRTGPHRRGALSQTRCAASARPGLVVFTFATTFAFIDWIMSLEPHWFSTIYGAMFLIGQMLEAFAFVILLVIVLSQMSPIKDYFTKQHLHDLGNMMFAWMVLWAYLSFSQFIIIWSGNLPEEIPWYLRRLRGGWGWVALTIVVFNSSCRLLCCCCASVKRDASRLFRVCVMMIVIRLVDDYWIIKPAFYNQQLKINWMDFVTPLAVGGLWLAAFFWQLKSRPLLPLKDPRLQGAPRETVAF